jgi:predicted acylesterase/phospholipase RssA
MARVRSSLPWQTVMFFGALFLVAWWIEGCLIYSVAWSDLPPVHEAKAAADTIGLTLLCTFLGYIVRSVGHLIGAIVYFFVTLIADAFDTLPAAWRETRPLRLLAQAGKSFVATYSGDSLVYLGAGLLWSVGLLFRVLLALNAAGWLYNLLRRFFRRLEMAIMAPIAFYSESSQREAESEIQADPKIQNGTSPASMRSPSGKTTRLQRRQEYQQFFDSHVRRIGIVLSGGGAKGAYQAGALKAIYEFLRAYDALGKVKMITGTSIGAWNAMFWLSGLMESKDGGAPGIESWWKSISFGALLDFPWLYLPFWSNSILRTTPWRESFFELFSKRVQRIFSEDIHFYLTRTQLNDGAVSYVTNRPDIENRLNELRLDKNDDYRFFEVLEGEKTTHLADALFSSMSLPPLCAPFESNGMVYEDASRCESLALRFAAPIEECDLVFILPLDASVDGTRRPLLKRMLHAMDSSKRALGRGVLKNADAINHQSERIERMEFAINALAPRIRNEGVAAELMTGLREEVAEFNQEYRRLYIFTISPVGPLELGDFDLWRRREAENAFDLMYVQTRRELMTRFFEDIEPEDAHVVMVDGLAPSGDDLPQPKYRSPSQL